MKWIEFFNYLNKEANNIHTLGRFNWQSDIKIHDVESGEVYDLDMIKIADNIPRIVINLNKISEERNPS